MELYDVIYNICQGARNASRSLANASGKDRNKILLCMAEKIRNAYEEIIEANKIDLANAKENGQLRVLEGNEKLSFVIEAGYIEREEKEIVKSKIFDILNRKN